MLNILLTIHQTHHGRSGGITIALHHTTLFLTSLIHISNENCIGIDIMQIPHVFHHIALVARAPITTQLAHKQITEGASVAHMSIARRPAAVAATALGAAVRLSRQVVVVGRHLAVQSVPQVLVIAQLAFERKTRRAQLAGHGTLVTAHMAVEGVGARERFAAHTTRHATDTVTAPRVNRQLLLPREHHTAHVTPVALRVKYLSVFS